MIDALVTWLRVQLDDEEREIQRHGPPIPATPWASASRITTIQAGATVLMHPTRLLAEVDATRRLLAWLEETRSWAQDNNLWNYDDTEAYKALALPYAGRPGYRPEWRPA